MAGPVQMERLGETEGFATFIVSLFPPDASVSVSAAFGGGFLCVARHDGKEHKEQRETAAAAAIAVLEHITKAAPRAVLEQVRSLSPIDEGVQLPLPLKDA